MYVGPVLLLIFGAFYLYLSPREANQKAGYRTFFGMGSVKAWNCTQKLAGMVWGGTGVLLLLVAIVGSIILSGQGADGAASTARVIVIIEAVCCVLAFLAVEILVALQFDANGNASIKKH